MAAWLFIVGLALVAVAVGALAGLWWGVLTLGLLLVALAVLTELGAKTAPTPAEGETS